MVTVASVTAASIPSMIGAVQPCQELLHYGPNILNTPELCLH